MIVQYTNVYLCKKMSLGHEFTLDKKNCKDLYFHILLISSFQNIYIHFFNPFAFNVSHFKYVSINNIF